MTSPREFALDVGGRRFGLLEWGPRRGPVVLALHGYPDTAWTWRLLAPMLVDRGWRVVAPFSRGYAPSSLARDGCYQVGALVRDIEDLAAALELSSDSVLLGHDWGAIVAMTAAAHSPRLASRIVTVAVPPMAALWPTVREGGPRRTLRLLARQSRLSWYVLFQQLPLLPEEAFPTVVRRLWKDWSPGYDPAEDLRHLERALPDRAHRSAALEYYRAFAQPWRRRAEYAGEQQCLGVLPSVPVLHVHGDDDGCILPAFCEGSVEVLAPRGRSVIIDGAGHFVQLERPKALASLILEFCNQPQEAS